MTKAELLAAIEALDLDDNDQVVFVTERKYGDVVSTKAVNKVEAVHFKEESFLSLES